MENNRAELIKAIYDAEKDQQESAPAELMKAINEAATGITLDSNDNTTKAGDIVIHHGKEFGDAIDDALNALVVDRSEKEESAPAGARVIETEEQVREFIDELNSMSPEDRKLTATKAAAEAFEQMEVIWNTLSRKRKREIMSSRMKFSEQAKRRLKTVSK